MNPIVTPFCPHYDPILTPFYPHFREKSKSIERDYGSRAFRANSKAVAKTDDNFVRALASRERGRAV